MTTEVTSPRVLVVEDDKDIREALGALLASEGFEVDLAVDGLDALSRFDREGQFSAVVCDLRMPRLDGANLVRTLRRRGQNVTVVIVSAHFDVLAATGNLGQVYALAKPFDSDRLVGILRQALEEHS